MSGLQMFRIHQLCEYGCQQKIWFHLAATYR